MQAVARMRQPDPPSSQSQATNKWLASGIPILPFDCLILSMHRFLCTLQTPIRVTLWSQERHFGDGLTSQQMQRRRHARRDAARESAPKDRRHTSRTDGLLKITDFPSSTSTVAPSSHRLRLGRLRSAPHRLRSGTETNQPRLARPTL